MRVKAQRNRKYIIPANLKALQACAFNVFMLTPVGNPFHDRTGVYPAGTKLHIGADDLDYEKTEKGWLPSYSFLGDLNIEQITATEPTEAKRKEAAAEIANIHEALNRYALYEGAGAYPTTNQGLQVLARPSAKNFGSPYIVAVPNDPWDHPYLYRSDGNNYELKSLGPDGVKSADDIKGN